MKTVARCILTSLLLGALLSAPRASAVTLGQIDTFEDGTTQNWIGGLGLGGGNPAPPVNALGGPAGAADHYLELSALGGGSAGGRLSVLNLAQWAGDYIAAGIGSISMDVRNLGTSDLALRLVFEDPTVGPPTNVAFSATPFLLPSGSGWTRAVFSIDPSALIAGLGDIETALENTTAIRIYHSVAPNFPNPVFPIEPIVARLGVDNIQAGPAVPEGGSSAMLLLPVLFVAGYFRRRAKRV